MQCLTFRDILAEDRAEQLKRETDQVAQELERRLLANVSSPGDFAAVHALPRSSVDIPDDPNELCSAKKVDPALIARFRPVMDRWLLRAGRPDDATDGCFGSQMLAAAA